MRDEDGRRIGGERMRILAHLTLQNIFERHRVQRSLGAFMLRLGDNLQLMGMGC